jgi:hypothetical protein
MSETAVTEKPKKRSFNEAERQRALTALVAASGNGRLAERTLAKEGFEINHRTLYEWAKRYEDDYRRIRAEYLPKIREAQADAHRALERKQLEVSLAATQRIAERIPVMEDKDLINAQGKADIGSGIHGDKAQLYDNQPTQIVRRSASEVLRELQAEGVVVDAEVVGEEDVGERDSASSSGSDEHGSAVAVAA